MTRVAAVTSWACFVCLAFGLYFRHKLARGELTLFMLMSVGIMLSSLLSAGRQSVVQLILLVLLLEAVRSNRIAKSSSSQWQLRALLISAAAFVVLFVTINRSTLLVGRSKADLFLVYFDARLSNWFEVMIKPFGDGVRDFITEVVLYVSSSVPLFSRFVDIDFGRPFYGVFDFPFVMRQLEPITGLSVVDSWNLRVRYLGSEGVIGTGWTTTPSHLILDFSVAGMIGFLFLQGAVSEWAWNRVRCGGGFGMVVICVILTIAAIYMPFVPALSDTNLFLLFVVMILMMIAKRSVSDARVMNHRVGHAYALAKDIE